LSSVHRANAKQVSAGHVIGPASTGYKVPTKKIISIAFGISNNAFGA